MPQKKYEGLNIFSEDDIYLLRLDKKIKKQSEETRFSKDKIACKWFI